MQKDMFEAVYGARPGPGMTEIYDDWAASYDEDLIQAGYATPTRIAAALGRCGANRDAALLDIGCGTGLSGQALARAGFGTLDGLDPSEGMRRMAAGKGVYRRLAASPGALAPPYKLVTACGAIGAGAAPLGLFDTAWGLLAPGGMFAFSFNDHTLEDPAYEARVNRAVRDDGATLLLREAGAHLPAKGLGAVVYVLRKG